MSAKTVKDALSGVIYPLLDNPKALELHLNVGDHSIIVNVICDQPDRAKIIGKGGKTYGALYLLGSNILAIHGLRLNLIIVE